MQDSFSFQTVSGLSAILPHGTRPPVTVRHAPPEHIPLHFIPHPPQLFGSEETSISQPSTPVEALQSQSSNPVGHWFVLIVLTQALQPLQASFGPQSESESQNSIASRLPLLQQPAVPRQAKSLQSAKPLRSSSPAVVQSSVTGEATT